MITMYAFVLPTDYKHDPFSEGNPCNAICCRGELRTKRPYVGGCIDTKVREGRKEGNGLFNDALNAFYLRLYGVRHMVKDHSDSEKGNPLSPHRLLFPINSKGTFICTIPQIG